MTESQLSLHGTYMEPEKPFRNIRVWQSLDPANIKKHLLLIDDLYGNCGNCKQIGLNFIKDRVCPNCKTEFRYLATVLKNPADVAKILARIRSDSLPFTMIDREDYDRASAEDAVANLFG